MVKAAIIFQGVVTEINSPVRPLNCNPAAIGLPGRYQ
jgi:hypothetical protein